jgi:two-component system, OmpR family, phosphate regulon sensor histidine kinase PhoR
MKLSINRYILISIFCVIILAVVQFILVYNTYELKNERFYFTEKGAIRNSYSKLIKNDKLFPGGEKIIDSFLLPNMSHLALMYDTDRRGFSGEIQKITDSLLQTLRKKESMQVFLTDFKRHKHLKDSFTYALMIESLSLYLGKNEYVNIYDLTENPFLIKSCIHEKEGIRIGGTLSDLNEQNKVIGLTITGSQPNSYRIGFRLYVEPLSRKITILSQMVITFLLSLASILFIVFLFLITFRNWLKQKKLSEMKSDFINNITHELNTPLAAIIVANKNLQNEKILEKKENIRPLTEVIERQSERLKRLIDEVMEIVTTEKIVLKKKEYSVNDLLDEILLDYRLQLTETDMSLDFNKKALKDNVNLDKFHFTTMMMNILGNGIKYNDKKEKKLSVVTENSTEGDLQIRISDNGIGMSPETISHIFEKFYRNSNPNIVQVKGLGLGLYYARQSAAAHNWNIKVESKLGTGSSFVIILPLES